MVCWVFVKQLIRVDKGRHLSVIGVGVGKEDESIMVLPADKGRASIVMDTNTYHTKMSTLIKNGPYYIFHDN